MTQKAEHWAAVLVFQTPNPHGDMAENQMTDLTISQQNAPAYLPSPSTQSCL